MKDMKVSILGQCVMTSLICLSVTGIYSGLMLLYGCLMCEGLNGTIRSFRMVESHWQHVQCQFNTPSDKCPFNAPPLGNHYRLCICDRRKCKIDRL